MSSSAPILRSLEIIHDARSSNEDRKQATIFLDNAKEEPDAPSTGLALAQDKLRPPVVRHFGLSLLEHCIQYKWETYTDDQTAQIRIWILELAHDVSPEVPSFIRNKIAQLLEETAEKSWGLTWLDFDEQLCNLWQVSVVHKELVLHTLHTLSERVFGKSESTSGTRGAELGRYCVEIFSPLPALNNNALEVGGGHRLRYDSDSWLGRTVSLLEQFLMSDQQTQALLRACCSMSFSVLRSAVLWIPLRAVATTNAIAVVCNFISTAQLEEQMAALEFLPALYHRFDFLLEDISKLVRPLLTANSISMLRTTYERLYTTVDEMDELKYVGLKRLTEVISSLSTMLERSPTITAEPLFDFDGFIDLLVQTLRNPSLTVSVPVLYAWTRLLNTRQVRYSPQFARVLSDLLEICNQRLIRFELLPSDSEEPTIQFLNEDIDTVPERHAFLGNYRRFCNNIIERIVRRSPFEALSHLLTQSSQFLRNVAEGRTKDTARPFANDTIEQLTVEAQCTVVTTAVKSYVRWLHSKKIEDQQTLANQESLRTAFESWCITMVEECPDDPVIQKRILSLVTEISILALPSSSHVGIGICERVLSSNLTKAPIATPYGEALRDLQSAQPRELQKLAVHFADQLFAAYDNIQASIERRLSAAEAEQRVRLDYQAFLLTIVQRSSVTSPEERQSRLEQMATPLLSSWQDDDLKRSTADLPSLLSRLGLQEYPTYFLSRKAEAIQDWSSVELDSDGIAMRDGIPTRVESLPLHGTRSLLTVITTQAGSGSGGSTSVADQLQSLTPLILPSLLKLIGLTHAFNNPDKWSNYPSEMRAIVARTVQDRVWQVGISAESRDAFFARVRASRSTLEGLASATRGAIRTVRELSMWTLHCLSEAGDAFYGHYDLPGPLAQALYEDGVWLSPHQLSGLLSLSSTLIDRCPPRHYQHFLPPLLVPLFKLLDAKTSAEWEALKQPNGTNGAATDALDSEMKHESVLRNLTHSAVLLVAHLLGPPPKGTSHQSSEEPTIRGLILTSPEVLESLALFATHTLRMHDNRSCSVTSRVLRSLIPEFQHDVSTMSSTSGVSIDASTAASVREFFSTEVLKACISSIHEPYFADLQRDLAGLVASILTLYSPKTGTPRQVLLSLPDMGEERVARCLEQLRKAANERQQRTMVLNLLDGVRGVSIHEQGKIPKALDVIRAAMQDRFMSVDGANDAPARGNSPELQGVSELFG